MYVRIVEEYFCYQVCCSPIYCLCSINTWCHLCVGIARVRGGGGGEGERWRISMCMCGGSVG